jgi:hypothetical protein
VFHRNPKALGDLAKGGSELLAFNFRAVIDILPTVKTEWTAHVVILGPAKLVINQSIITFLD